MRARVLFVVCLRGSGCGGGGGGAALTLFAIRCNAEEDATRDSTPRDEPLDNDSSRHTNGAADATASNRGADDNGDGSNANAATNVSNGVNGGSARHSDVGGSGRKRARLSDGNSAALDEPAPKAFASAYLEFQALQRG